MLKRGLLEIKVGIRYDSETSELIHHLKQNSTINSVLLQMALTNYHFRSVNETKRGWLENQESKMFTNLWNR